ncbi:MAG: acetate--CoA ligase [Methanomassiliicoccales archaeon]|nr:MAG: acetate--CoA ligase [Methanomassiliicoccales archaeon]
MSEKTIESVMEEDRRFEPAKEFSERAHIRSMAEYEKMYAESIKDPVAFWEKYADCLHWFARWNNVFSWDVNEARIRWFEGGKTNACYNCVDRHALGPRKNKAAIIWQGENDEEVKTYTYQQLMVEVSKFANVLKSKGVQKGDRVSIYLPMIPELVISMLACARIGAIHSVVFGGFSSDSLRDRINDSSCKLLITADGNHRGGKLVTLKQNADAALEKGTSVECVLVVKRAGNEVVMEEGRDFWLHEEMKKASHVCDPVWMDAEDPLFILYTSGSTGKPKGVVHTTGGYLVYAATTFKYIFDYHDEDVYWCTADCGWITGHSYITYGPLLNGATQIVFEGIPTYPAVDRFWQVVEKFGVNIFYTAPTAIRSLMREGEKWPNGRDLSSLRLLGSVGEPINPEAWIWYHKHIGREKCPIVDTWWQTETGGIMITPLPGATVTKPGSATFPFFGIEPAIYKEDGKPAEPNEGGYLVIKKPWPGIMRTVYGQHERFKETYWSRFPGVYFTGDSARKDKDGYIWIMGRVDDVIKVSGHRIGAAEVESALVAHPKVAEAAVVPMPHEIKGEAIYAYVTLKTGVEESPELVKELILHVRKMVGPIAAPDVIQFAPGLPKTRSGKIMRRILRKIASDQEEELGDTTTLADPTVVDKLVADHKKIKKK